MIAGRLWLAFQLTCAVCQIHEEGFYHGDIKIDNVVVTSWNWIFLTDFAPYKPIYLHSDNLGDYQYYFSRESSKTAGCYSAPEKFVTTDFDTNLESLEAKQAMDIFSLGCVIAEIFLDNGPLFDLAKLQAYKNCAYDPMRVLSEIKAEGMSDIILDMIAINPGERKSARDYVQILIKKAIPPFISQFAYYFMGTMVHPALTSPDRKVAMVFTHLDAIWRCCFQKQVPLIVQSMNDSVFESIRTVPINEIIFQMIPHELPYCIKYTDISKILIDDLFPISSSMK